MVIEHSFISTYPSEFILESALAYLRERGFRAIIADTTGQIIELERGVQKSAKAKSIVELPQKVRLEVDRGRVSIAALIEPSLTWGGQGAFYTAGRPKKMVVHQELLEGILTGLETLLAHDCTGATDYAAWDAAEAEAVRLSEARSRRQRNTIFTIAGIVVLLFIAFWVMIALSLRR
ncbi:MAG: hypothetical protein QM754_16965 [Tepidisphaeraceae bacterium]